MDILDPSKNEISPYVGKSFKKYYNFHISWLLVLYNLFTGLTHVCQSILKWLKFNVLNMSLKIILKVLADTCNGLNSFISFLWLSNVLA